MRPDWSTESFWRWAIDTCEARVAILARWFPEVSPGGWDTRKGRARRDYQHLAWPKLTNSNKLPEYPESPPDGWPAI